MGKQLRGCARKIILSGDLLRQSKAQSMFPARFPVPEGTLEMISADHVVVKPRNCAFDPVVEINTCL